MRFLARILISASASFQDTAEYLHIIIHYNPPLTMADGHHWPGTGPVHFDNRSETAYGTTQEAGPGPEAGPGRGRYEIDSQVPTSSNLRGRHLQNFLQEIPSNIKYERHDSEVSARRRTAQSLAEFDAMFERSGSTLSESPTRRPYPSYRDDSQVPIDPLPRRSSLSTHQGSDTSDTCDSAETAEPADSDAELKHSAPAWNRDESSGVRNSESDVESWSIPEDETPFAPVSTSRSFVNLDDERLFSPTKYFERLERLESLVLQRSCFSSCEVSLLLTLLIDKHFSNVPRSSRGGLLKRKKLPHISILRRPFQMPKICVAKLRLWGFMRRLCLPLTPELWKSTAEF